MKYCCSVIAAGLVLSLTISSAIAASKSLSWQVTPDSAKAAAECLVASRASAKLGPFPQWKDVKIGEPTKYVGLDGEVTAYCFPVEKDKVDVGYVMVDASRFEMPVQEFSCSAPPHKRANMEACRKAAKEAAGEGMERGALRYAYPAPGLYAVEFPLLDKGVSAGSVYVDVVNSQVIKDAVSVDKQEPSVSRSGKAGTGWLSVTDSKASSKGSKVNPEFKYVINVPLMVRRTVPEAVAWATVLNYWGVRKPREIPDIIAQQLSKSGVGSDSLQGYAKERGFGLKLGIKQRDADAPDAPASFTDIRMEVDSGRPFVVMATAKPTIGKPVTSVLAGSGYAVDEMGQWLIVHTGISPTESIPQVDESTPWCRPGVVFVNWDCAVDSLTVTAVQVSREGMKIGD